jgi:hypothetical protein
MTINSLAVYNGKLYGGTSPNGKLYEWDGVDQWVEKAPQLGSEMTINSLAVFNGKLYSGTSPNGKLYEWDGSGAWISKATLGAGTDILSLAVFNGNLYGGSSPDGSLYQWNGVNAWTLKAPQLGAETSINDLTLFNSKLYGSTGPNGRLYEWDETSAWIQRTPITRITSLVLFTDNKVYGGTSDGRLLQWDSGDQKWLVVAPQIGTETSINCLAVFGTPSKIYAGTSPNGKLYEWDGVDSWIQAADRGALTFTDITSLAAYNGKLYAGTNPGAYLCSWVSPQTSWVQEKTAPGETAITALATRVSTKNKLYNFTDNSGGWTDGVNAASSNDQYASYTPTATETRSPTQNLAGGGGAWTNPTRAYADDTSRATAGLNGRQQIYYGYGYALSAGSSVTQVRVRLDAFCASANQRIILAVSTDGGTTWLPTTYTTPSLPTAETTYWVDVTGWTTWTPALVNNIRTRVESVRTAGTINLDWVPVEVTYYNPTVTRSPTQNLAGGGGAWTNPTRAYADDTSRATAGLNGRQQIYYGYGYALSAGSSVTQVRVRLDAFCASANQRIILAVSTDGGTTWLPTTYTTPSLPTAETTYWVDVTGWTTWTPALVNNIRTRVESVRTAGTINLDWVPVEVTYYNPPETHTFTNFNVNPEGDTVTKVEVGVEGYTEVDERLSVTVSWDGGTSWAPAQIIDPPTSDPNSLTYIDFTGATAWTKTKLLNTTFIVQVTVSYQGTQVSTSYIDYICARVTSTSNELYASTSPNTYLYTLTPSDTWTQKVTTKYSSENAILSLKFLNNTVYGCSSPGGYLLMRDTGGSSTSWTKVTDPPATQKVVSLLTDGVDLYGGTTPNGYLYKLTGSAWTPVVTTQYPVENSILSMVFDSGSNLRAGTDINGLLLGVSGSNWVKNAELESNGILSLCVFSSKLYGGTDTAGQLYEWDGASAWLLRADTKDGQTDINDLVADTSAGKLYGAANPLGLLFEWNPVPGEWINKIASTSMITSVDSLAVFNGNLYAGTSPNGKLYEWNGARAWVEKAPQLGAETSINSLAVFNGNLYAGTSPNGKLYEWNGLNTWVEKAPKLGSETSINSLAVYNGKLYGGTSPNGKLYEWNDINVWIEKAPKLGAETSINSLAVYNGKLYGGTSPNGKLYEWNDVNAWLDRITPTYIPSLTVYNGKIYGGTSYGALYEWDSTALKWVQRAPRLGSESKIVSLNTFNGNLYGGTSPGGKLYEWNDVNQWVEKASTQLTQASINALVVNTVSNKLYGGTSPNGCLLEWDGASTWVNNAYFSQVASMAYFNGKLYAGTSRTGKLFERNDFDAWVEKAPQLGSETDIVCLAVFNDKLYAGTNPGGRLYEWDGNNAWIQRTSTTLNSQTTINSLVVLGTNLYGGTSPGGRLFRWATGATVWTQVAGALGGQTSINSLLVFNMELFGSTGPGGRLFKWDSVNQWVEMAPQLGSETSIMCLAVFNGKLYGGTSPNGKLYEWNGVDQWVEKAPKLGSETSILSLASYNGKLYGGTNPGGRLYEWNTVDAWVEKASTRNQQSSIKTLIVDSGTNLLYAGTLVKPFIFEFSDSSPRVATDFFKGYDNAWIKVSIVADYSGKKVQFYRNGVLFSTLTITSEFVAPTASPIYVGSFANKGNYFKGYLDELRISTSARSDKWIATTYSNEANPENFYTMGTIESLSGLKLKVRVEDANGALPKTTLDVNLFYCYQGDPYPEFAQAPIKTVDTDQNGEAVINYPDLPTDITLFAAVRARYTNIYGVGYTTYTPKADMTPFVTSYENGQITLVHKRYLDAGYPYSGDLYYNATMVLPVGESEFRNVKITDSTGRISTSTEGVIDLGSDLKGTPGTIMIFTRTDTGKYAVTVVPWGLTLGSHVTFGEAPLDATNVVSKSRLVMVGRYTYKVTLEMWRK